MTSCHSLSDVVSIKTLLIAASAFALLASAPAFANDCSANNNNNGSNNPGQRFVNEAASSNLAKVHLGLMAAQKGNSPAIKEFGRWIASDSVTLNKALVSLCQLENDYPRPVTSTSGMFLEQQLQTAKGKKFDQKFLQAVTDISDKNIHMYRAEEANGNNGNNGNTPPALQFYVKDVQPMLQAHLTEAQRLQHVEGFPVTAPPAMPTTAVPATGATVSPATTRTGTSGQSQAR